MGNDSEEWYLHGKLHRLDGPAKLCKIVTKDGESFIHKSWFVVGLARVKSLGSDSPSDENLTGTIRYTEGCYETYKDGLLHSFDDKPAMEVFGRLFWYQNGVQNRDNAPAAEDRFFDLGGTRSFRESWVTEGNHYLTTAPNTRSWLSFKDGEYHREGYPAVRRISGSEEWYIQGKRHREEGPAKYAIHPKLRGSFMAPGWSLILPGHLFP